MGTERSGDHNMAASVFSVHILNWFGVRSVYDWRDVHCAHDRKQCQVMINFYLIDRFDG